MQDRANTRKPLVSITYDDRNIKTSYTPWGEEANISGDKPSKKLLTFPSISETHQQTNKRYQQEIYNSGSTRMKFLCNFGGRFLPRPVDGKLRYVGGEKHLIQISQRLSWQELISKTTKLIRQAHIVKYHLPGECVNVLISVSSDDDVQHMIDECIVLEESKERPTMYPYLLMKMMSIMYILWRLSKPVHKWPSSDESMINTRCSSQEDIIPYSDTDQLNKIRSTKLQNRTEWLCPYPDIWVKNEAGAHILWDDTYISVMNPYSHEQVHETRENKQALPANATLDRDIISNVQVISNEDLKICRRWALVHLELSSMEDGEEQMLPSNG
ncbi:unnamed protein product [Miscanthus lutarioriparius]|uniref:PB1 domain-containing protein n=1 Tax=Miscanthus lutarioriparius TaxID=422564 RepID=A0A811NI56_9POAL|nr:unnamed protein product [Miscanthus lutarioriparius]